jgi:hypothetical protein
VICAFETVNGLQCSDEFSASKSGINGEILLQDKAKTTDNLLVWHGA